MGFPMTVERVVARNRLNEQNGILMDDLRRLAEDAVTLAIKSEEDRKRQITEDNADIVNYIFRQVGIASIKYGTDHWRDKADPMLVKAADALAVGPSEK